jgi:hypothetical protein
MMARIGFPAVLLLTGLLFGCVNDNEKDLFPRAVIPDTALQGQLAWFPFDSSLADKLGNQDPLSISGPLEFGRDHAGKGAGALVFDGIRNYLYGFLTRNDSLAVSLWILPMPNYRSAYLVDYGLSQFAAGLDAVTSATMPRFRMFIKQDTAVWYWNNEVDYFFWHHIYIEIGDTLNPPRLYIDGYPAEPADRPWKMHPLADLLYLGRPFNADIMDTLLYRGYLDDVRIFNKFLSEDEILSLYWEGRPTN